MRSKVRAYSHQGHGPRADQQAGYISATSDSTLTCERQPVHTLGATRVRRIPGCHLGDEVAPGAVHRDHEVGTTHLPRRIGRSEAKANTDPATRTEINDCASRS